MNPTTNQVNRLWLRSCLLFVGSLCFFVSAAIERDSWIRLMAGVVTWIIAFMGLVQLRPRTAAQPAGAADAPQTARG